VHAGLTFTDCAIFFFDFLPSELRPQDLKSPDGACDDDHSRGFPVQPMQEPVLHGLDPGHFGNLWKQGEHERLERIRLSL
jgi:hypothetical protein